MAAIGRFALPFVLVAACSKSDPPKDEPHRNPPAHVPDGVEAELRARQALDAQLEAARAKVDAAVSEISVATDAAQLDAGKAKLKAAAAEYEQLQARSVELDLARQARERPRPCVDNPLDC